MKTTAGALAITLAVSVLASCAGSPPPAHVPSPAPAAPPGHPAPTAVLAARTARLYPANGAALAGGVRTAQLTDDGGGRGTIEFSMPYGETIKGEYSPVVGDNVGFGSIYKAVFGPNAVATASTAPSRNPGTVSAYGVDGTRVACEYYSDPASGHASGACHTSTGFLYRLQY